MASQPRKGDVPMQNEDSVTSIYPLIKKKLEALDSVDYKRYRKDDYKRYLNEFGSFYLNFGRGSGHTELARMILKDNENSYVFTINHSMAKSNFKEFNWRYFVLGDISFRGKCFCKDPIFIVDCYYLAKKSFIKELKTWHPKAIIYLE